MKLTEPRAAGTLDQAPVTVNITTGTARGALVVPVTALVARTRGRYAVEVAGPGSSRRWVPVTPGIFDDASGLVQVTGALTPGQRVVVPRHDRALVLELDEVSKVYPGSPPVRALDRASLAVAAGELVAVTGPSGSGKSTLLHLMGTLDQPTAGTVRITGIDVARMRDRELAALRASRIGFVFQQFFLAEHQSALGNVADGLLYAGVRRAERRRLAAHALDRRRARTPGRRPADPAVRGRAAAGRDRPGDRRPPAGAAGRRADREPRLGHRRLDPGPAGGAQPAGTTIIIITHDHAVAARTRRRIEMLDGHVIAETSPSIRSRLGRRRPVPRRTVMTTTAAAAPARPGCAPPTWPPWPASGCGPASCAPGCRRWASRSASPRSSPSSAWPPPPRPRCWPRSAAWAPTC